jgi:hypothetical protein
MLGGSGQGLSAKRKAQESERFGEGRWMPQQDVAMLPFSTIVSTLTTHHSAFHTTSISMPILMRFSALLLLLVAPATLQAQGAAAAKPDSARPSMDDHMMGPWKEMNAFHRVMGATWHPASSKNDLAPLKARAKDLATSAETWAASKPPTTPASCGSAEVLAAVTKVAREAKALVTLVDAGADDAKLKAALKGVHDTFELAGHSC